MSWLDNFTKRLPPPDNPAEVGSLNWDNVESTLKTVLPNQYKEFVSLYGTGCIGNFLWILNPCSSNSSLNLIDIVQHDQEAYQYLQSQYADQYNRPSIPNERSFLTWAITDNGDSLSWEVFGTPDRWQVGIHNTSLDDEENYGLSFAEFLQAFLNRDLDSKILPIQFLDKDMAFVQS